MWVVRVSERENRGERGQEIKTTRKYPRTKVTDVQIERVCVYQDDDQVKHQQEILRKFQNTRFPEFAHCLPSYIFHVLKILYKVKCTLFLLRVAVSFDKCLNTAAVEI